MSKKVGKCPEHGIVHGEDVIWAFPCPAKCAICERDLDVAKVVSDKEFDEAMA